MADMEDVAELARHTYGGHDYICEMLPEWCASPLCCPFGIEVAGRLVALEVARLLDSGDTVWLEALRVHPSMRRRGLARRLQRVTLCGARRRWPALRRVRYTTQLSNSASVTLAHGCGMREVRRWAFVFVPAVEAPLFCERARRLLAQLKAEVAAAEGGMGAAAPPASTCNADAGALLRALEQHGGAPFIHDWKVYESTAANAHKLLGAGVTAVVGAGGSYCLAINRPDNAGRLLVLTVCTQAAAAAAAAGERAQIRCLLAHLCTAFEGSGNECESENGRALMIHFPPALWATLRAAGLAPRTSVGAPGGIGEAGCAAESTTVLLERRFVSQNQGTDVWLPRRRDFVVPATVVGQSFAAGSPGVVRLRGGEEITLSAAETAGVTGPVDPQVFSPEVDDLIHLNQLTNEAVLYKLRLRFDADQIYTNVSSILVSVNPFKRLPLYTPAMLSRYQDPTLTDHAPHIFGVARSAYRSILSAYAYRQGPAGAAADEPGAAEGVSASDGGSSGGGSMLQLQQSVVISGESGAGKTEATKQILQYITAASKRADTHAAREARRALGGEGEGGQGEHGEARPRSSTHHHHSHTASLEQQILAANPLLEAFGNAKTLRNDNSSRFGKLSSVYVARSGQIVGASIVDYLLEKSRVVHQQRGERNYHAFYQLLAGAARGPADDAGGAEGSEGGGLQERLALLPARQYTFLGGDEAQPELVINGDNRVAQYDEVVEAMEALGMDAERRHAIFELLSAVLLLGNVEFEVAAADHHGDDACAPTAASEATLARSAALVGLDTAELCRVLTSRQLSAAGGRGARGSVYKVDLSAEQAAHARDAAAKQLYARLFAWIVGQANDSFVIGHQHLEDAKDGGGQEGVRDNASGQQRQRRSVASAVVDATQGAVHILDIYGFEIFETNSFEQLCINYCNEQLQWFFNQHVFRLEQQEYERQGVKAQHIEFQDNSACLALIDAREPPGIFALLDEEVHVPRGSDSTLLSKLLSRFDGSSTATRHANFVRPKVTVADKRYERCFGVVHFAGTVFYCVDDFLDKNRDRLHPDIEKLFGESRSAFVREQLMGGYANADQLPSAGKGRRGSRLSVVKPPPRRKPGAKRTAGAKFKSQLAQLMSDLGATQPHFVRCMKPNDTLRPARFDGALMQHQLQCNGLLEVCAIRQMGFPVRLDFDHFLRRYQVLARGRGENLLVGPLPTELDGPRGLLARLEKLGLLETGEWARGRSKIFLRAPQAEKLECWEEMRVRAAVAIQRCGRGYLAVRMRRRCAETGHALEEAMATRAASALRKLLVRVDALPAGFRRRSLVQRARELLPAILREHEANEKRVKGALEAAVASRRKSQLEAALALAASASAELAECDEALMASLLLEALVEEEQLHEDVRALAATVKAAKSDAELPPFDVVVSLLARAAQLGYFDDGVVVLERAKQRLKDAVVAELRSALGQRQLGPLRVAVAKLEQLVSLEAAAGGGSHANGGDNELLAQARDLVAALQDAEEVRAELRAAAESRDPQLLRAALLRAEACDALLDEATSEGGCPELAAARAAILLLQKQAAAAARLEAAIEDGAVAALEEALAEAAALGCDDALLARGGQLQQRLAAKRDRQRVLAQLAQCDGLDLEELQALLARGELLDLDVGDEAEGEVVMRTARERLQQLLAQDAARRELAKACDTRDASLLVLAIARATELLSADAEQVGGALAEARALLERLELEEQAARRLQRMTKRARSAVAATGEHGKYDDYGVVRALGELRAALTYAEQLAAPSAASEEGAAARELAKQMARRIELLGQLLSAAARRDLCGMLDALDALKAMPAPHWASVQARADMQRALALKRRLVAEFESGQPVIQGWLLKRGDDRLLRSKAFKRRWCLVAGGELRYASKPDFKHGSQLGKIVLNKCSELHEGESGERADFVPKTWKGVERAPADQDQRFVFELVTPARTWVLASPDVGERKRWVGKLRDACRLARMSAAGGLTESEDAAVLGASLGSVIHRRAGSEVGALRAGNLQKKSHRLEFRSSDKLWKDRHVVLRQGLLEYFENAGGAKRGEVALVGGGVRIEGVAKDEEHPHAFSLASNALSSAAPLMLAAGTSATLRAWTDTLEIAWLSDEGKTRMMVAAQMGNSDNLKQLLATLVSVSTGATTEQLLNATDYSGCSALMHAAAAGEQACVSILLDAGAQIGLVDVRGRDALLHAVTNGQSGCAELLPRAPEVLVQSGDICASFGARAELEISVACFPFPMVRWEHDRKVVGTTVFAGSNHDGSRKRAASKPEPLEATWKQSTWQKGSSSDGGNGDGDEDEGRWVHTFTLVVHAVVNESFCGEYTAVITCGQDVVRSKGCMVVLTSAEDGDHEQHQHGAVVDLTSTVSELAELVSSFLDCALYLLWVRSPDGARGVCSVAEASVLEDSLYALSHLAVAKARTADSASSPGQANVQYMLMEMACRMLANIMFESQDATHAAARTLGTTLVRVISMHVLGNITVIAENVPLLLQASADIGEGGSDTNSQTCLEAIVEAMEAYGENIAGLRAATDVVGNFACADDIDDDEELASASARNLERRRLTVIGRDAVRRIIDDGALAAIVTATRSHKHEPALMVSVFDACLNMADDAEAQAAMVREGMTAVVMDVLAAAVVPRHAKRDTHQHHVVAVASALMRRSAPQQFEDLLSRAVELLAVLTECRAAVPMVANAHGVSALLNVMLAHGVGAAVKDDGNLARQVGARDLASLSMPPEARDNLLLCCAVALENVAYDAMGAQELQRALLAVERQRGASADAGVQQLLGLLGMAQRRGGVTGRELAHSLMRTLLSVCPEQALAERIVGIADASKHEGVLCVTAALRVWTDDHIGDAVFAILSQLAHSLPCAKRLASAGVHRLALKSLQAHAQAPPSPSEAKETLSMLKHSMFLLELLVTHVGGSLATQLKAQGALDAVEKLGVVYGASEHRALGRQCAALVGMLTGRKVAAADEDVTALPDLGSSASKRTESRRRTQQMKNEAASAKRLMKLHLNLSTAGAEIDVAQLHGVGAVAGEDESVEPARSSIGELPPPPDRPREPSNAPPPPSTRPPAESIAPPPPPDGTPLPPPRDDASKNTPLMGESVQADGTGASG
eukprot:g2526.t1